MNQFCMHVEDMLQVLSNRLFEFNDMTSLSEFEQGRQCAYEEMMDIIKTRHKIILDILRDI